MVPKRNTPWVAELPALEYVEVFLTVRRGPPIPLTDDSLEKALWRHFERPQIPSKDQLVSSILIVFYPPLRWARLIPNHVVTEWVIPYVLDYCETDQSLGLYGFTTVSGHLNMFVEWFVTIETSYSTFDVHNLRLINFGSRRDVLILGHCKAVSTFRMMTRSKRCRI